MKNVQEIETGKVVRVDNNTAQKMVDSGKFVFVPKNTNLFLMKK
jgi:hypothetical protein